MPTDKSGTSVSQRYRWTLSPQALENALREINEPDDDLKRLSTIDKLKEDFKKQNPKLKLYTEKDSVLLKFLRARCFQQNEVLKLLKNYIIQRNEWSELFTKIENPDLLKEALTAGIACPLQGHAKNGNVVVVTRFGKNNIDRLDDCLATYCLTLEHLLQNEENQIHGFVVIHDLSFTNIHMMSKVKPALIKRVISLIQHGFPIRVTKIFLLHQPSVFTNVFTMLRSFATPFARQKLVMIGNEYERMFDIVDQSVLPSIFKGTGPEIDWKRWKEEILTRNLT